MSEKESKELGKIKDGEEKCPHCGSNSTVEFQDEDKPGIMCQNCGVGIL